MRSTTSDLNGLSMLLIGLLSINSDSASQQNGTAGENVTVTTSTTPFPFSLLYQHCGIDVPDGKECYAEANLVCSDYERTQWSICVCKSGTEPRHGRLACAPPTKIIRVGDACNPNATEEEEQCSSDLAYCDKNGTCICGDDGWGQVLYDKMHKDCYLKSEPRNHNLTNKAGGHSRTAILTVLITPAVLPLIIGKF